MNFIRVTCILGVGLMEILNYKGKGKGKGHLATGRGGPRGSG